MGVLDDLKREAASVRALEEKSRLSEQAQLEAVLNKLAPKMRELYDFFKALAETLNVVRPDVWANYQVDGFGALQGLHQEDYRLTAPDNRALTQLTFRYNCVSEGGAKFRIRGKQAAERQRQYMWEHNLRFTGKTLADDSGEFFLESFVPVTFEFQSEPERGAILLRLRNLNELGSSKFLYDPDQLTPELLDEMGKAVLRQPNRFDELSGNKLSDEMRKRLRQQLAHDGYKKRAENGGSDSSDIQDGTVAKKKGLLGGFLRRG